MYRAYNNRLRRREMRRNETSNQQWSCCTEPKRLQHRDFSLSEINQGESNRLLASVKAMFDTRKMVRNSKPLSPQAEATFVYFHTIVFDKYGDRTLVAHCKK